MKTIHIFQIKTSIIFELSGSQDVEVFHLLWQLGAKCNFQINALKKIIKSSALVSPPLLFASQSLWSNLKVIEFWFKPSSAVHFWKLYWNKN